jgi:hypothetical protein
MRRNTQTQRCSANDFTIQTATPAEVPMLVNNTGRIRCNDSTVLLLSPIIPLLSFPFPRRILYLPYGRLDVHVLNSLFSVPLSSVGDHRLF